MTCARFGRFAVNLQSNTINYGTLGPALPRGKFVYITDPASEREFRADGEAWIEWIANRGATDEQIAHLRAAFDHAWSVIVSSPPTVNDKPAKPSKPRKAKDNSRRIPFQGRSLTLREWSALTGISASTLYARLHRGYSPERIFEGVRLSTDTAAE
jgi:hypothetical protein